MKATLNAKPPRRHARPPVGHLRPLRAGDESRLQEFFNSHTAETIYERYGSPITTMTAARAHELVAVDQTRDCALGIFTLDGGALLAVGRYCLDPAGDAAELAFVVRESMRRRGLATKLLQRLVARAREQGLRRLWAMTNTHNAAMLGILRGHDFDVRPDPGTGEVLATLELDPA